MVIEEMMVDKKAVRDEVEIKAPLALMQFSWYEPAIGLGAHYSGDKRLLEDYRFGDPVDSFKSSVLFSSYYDILKRVDEVVLQDAYRAFIYGMDINAHPFFCANIEEQARAGLLAFLEERYAWYVARAKAFQNESYRHGPDSEMIHVASNERNYIFNKSMNAYNRALSFVHDYALRKFAVLGMDTLDSISVTHSPSTGLFVSAPKGTISHAFEVFTDSFGIASQELFCGLDYMRLDFQAVEGFDSVYAWTHSKSHFSCHIV